MMICSSKGMSNEQVEFTLSQIEGSAFKSRRDGCEVMLVRCAECCQAFEEEVSAFRDKIIARSDLFCLACDDEASIHAFTAVTIQIGWVG